MKKLLILTGCCWLFACKNEEAPKPATGEFDCSTAKITSSYAVALLQTNCSNRGCHPGGGPPNANFSTAANIKAYVTANAATFAARVTGPNADMPQSKGFPALSQAAKDSLACWINHGMPDQ
jgi:hypothetical protein